MGCDSPLKGFRDMATGGIQFRRENAGEKMEVPCGQCLGCRLDHSRMWAMRITHEAAMHEHDGGNCFITLTYRDRRACTLEQLENGLHVPDDWSLDKTHVQKFIKRLRKYFGKQKIKYFYCGEYGRKCQHGIDVDRVGCPLCNVGRPHYHLCLFNGTFGDLEPYESDNGIIRYTSPTLTRLWGYGHVDIGDLNYASAKYCAKYILKKVKKTNTPDWYTTLNIETGELVYITPEYVAMSRGNASYKGQKCGIGASWLGNYFSDVFPSDEVPVPGHGVIKGVPRYYTETLKDWNPEMYETVKKHRKAFMKAHKEEYSDDRLRQKHICKKARVKEENIRRPL
jgi:hypothetical protein